MLILFLGFAIAFSQQIQSTSSQQIQKNDPGASWLFTSFHPFTYEHKPAVLEVGDYIEDLGLDYKEPKNVQNIYDRKTWLYQTFKEVKTIQDYYSETDINIKGDVSIGKFGGSYNRNEKHSFNHSSMTLNKMYIGSAREIIKYLVVDPKSRNFTKEWNERFYGLFNTLDKIPEMCPGLDIVKGTSLANTPEKFLTLVPNCIPLRAAINQINQMIKDGAWIVTGVELGGAVTVKVTLNANQVETLTDDQVTQAVGASFGSYFSGSYSKSTTVQTMDMVYQALRNRQVSMVGGEGTFNDTDSEFTKWQDSVYRRPAVFGVTLVRLSKLVTIDRFPDIDPFKVAYAQSLIDSQINAVIELNIPVGCGTFNDANFDPNTMKSNDPLGKCVLDNNYTFGGFVQTSVSLEPNDPQATCQPTVYASPDSNSKDRKLCPDGWHPVDIIKGGVSVPEYYNTPDYNQCWHESGGWFHSGHTVCPCRINIHWALCHWYEVQYVCNNNPAVCVKDNSTVSNGFAKLSGGLYSLQQPNPTTGGPSCPEGFTGVPLVNGAVISCEAFPGTANDKYAVPFGGLYAGNVPNALTGKYCPHGHSRYYLGNLLGVPWYQCLAYISPYMEREWEDLPIMSYDDYIITYKNKTIRLTSKMSFDAQMGISDPSSAPAIIGLSITVGFLVVILTTIILITLYKPKWIDRIRMLAPRNGGGYSEIV